MDLHHIQLHQDVEVEFVLNNILSDFGSVDKQFEEVVAEMPPSTAVVRPWQYQVDIPQNSTFLTVKQKPKWSNTSIETCLPIFSILPRSRVPKED